ncbi:MAG: methyltransferase domain-containing protein [Verrucomicrobiota bacterium]
MKERPNEKALNKSFEFDALNEAENYRRALIRDFSEFLRGNVIEVGSGIGQMTELLQKIPAITKLQAVEPDTAFCGEFRKKFRTQLLIEGTIDALEQKTNWDAILSINVLEHIRDDEHELQTYHGFLRQNHGTLNLFVPARQEIYAPLDHDFGHHRRYAKPELKRKLEKAGFEIVRMRYFNFAGYFAWWLNFCFLRRRQFNSNAVKFYDRIIFPAVYKIESSGIPFPIGQSLIAVARVV